MDLNLYVLFALTSYCFPIESVPHVLFYKYHHSIAHTRGQVRYSLYLKVAEKDIILFTNSNANTQ